MMTSLMLRLSKMRTKTMAESLAENIAKLTSPERDVLLEGFDLEKLVYDPEFWLRPEQLTALRAQEWLIAMLAGRGAGKTRTGAEWIREQAKTPMTRIALVGRTAADVRDTMIQGESGILAIHPQSEMPEYLPSLRRLVWPNGSVAITFSAEEPSQLRGPQFHKAWADEVAAWKMKPDNSGLNSWDNLQIATRLGANPQIFMTTTPKRVPAIRKILDMVNTDPGRVKMVRGSTLDNAANLASAYIETITGMYAGTSIERQELFGELLDQVEGALWTEQMIKHEYDLAVAEIPNRITVVGVDPSVAERPNDECGIVVVTGTMDKLIHERRAWVLDDRSVLGSPDVWAKTVAQTARDWGGIVVVEKNQGHHLVKMALQSVDPMIPIVMVNAGSSKQGRAEPVMMAYEQGRVAHIGSFVELEDQMTSWVPGESGYSPDRMDALVWAVRALMVDSKILGSVSGPIRASRRVMQSHIQGAIPAYRLNRASPKY
jgi:phage terminase large subunit-like protein